MTPLKPPHDLPVTFPDFGQWLSFREAIKSQTATRLELSNVPTPAQYDNMKRLYQAVYAPLCARFGKLPVSSFFRSYAVNKAVGGSPTSDHVNGRAIDIDCDGRVDGLTNRVLFNYILHHLSFDQLILEAPDANGNPQWVHIGYRSLRENREEVLEMRRIGGKSVYRKL